MNAITARPAPASSQSWGVALGIPAVVLVAVSFAFAGNAPGTTDSDAKITSWYASTSHQHAQILGFLGFTLGVLCLIGFLAALRERMAAAENEPGAACQLAFGAGVASAALFALAIALFSVPAFLASDTSATDIVPGTYRMFNTAGYASWVAATMIAALTVAATSATALRTSLLPRWFAWLGVLVGIIQLLGFFFIPGFAYWAWVLIAAALLLRRPRASSMRGTPA